MVVGVRRLLNLESSMSKSSPDKQEVLDAIRQAEEGRVLSQEEVERRMAKWLGK